MSGGELKRRSSFWSELYWFVVMALVGWIVAALFLPPRIATLARLYRQERMVLGEIQALREEENILEGAVSAMENDPFYREGVFRERLGVKKIEEEFLEPPPPPSDN